MADPANVSDRPGVPHDCHRVPVALDRVDRGMVDRGP